MDYWSAWKKNSSNKKFDRNTQATKSSSHKITVEMPNILKREG